MADPKKEDLEKEKQMDEMVDSLLAAYSAEEPRPGLETRILAGLREAASREASPTAWNFKWLWAALAVAAAIIVAAVLIGRGRHVSQPANTVVQTQQPVSPQPEIQHILPPTTANTVRHDRKPSVAVRPQNATLALNQRPAVFPTPTPLSEQEQLLLRYFAGTPREEVVAQSHADEPVVIGEDESKVVLPDLVSVPQKSGNTR
jgi:hypothetical protein